MSDERDSSERSEYRRWVETLPAEMHGALMVGDVVPTAFYRARRAGWDLEALVFDAAATVRRGGKVGVLVERLRTLAATSPTATRSRPSDARFADRILERFEVANDPDGERRQLWGRIMAGDLTPDASEVEMRALNLSLADRHGVRTGYRVPTPN